MRRFHLPLERMIVNLNTIVDLGGIGGMDAHADVNDYVDVGRARPRPCLPLPTTKTLQFKVFRIK